MPAANTHQVGGAHYSGADVQHWDYVNQALGNDYYMGNVTKYVARHRRKNGKQDLMKALHYLDKTEELFVTGKLKPRFAAYDERNVPEVARTFIRLNGLTIAEACVITRAAIWSDQEDLRLMRAAVLWLLQHADDGAEPGRGYVDQDNSLFYSGI